MALTNNKFITDWVAEQAELCKPDQIVWIDGSEEQLAELRAEGFSTGELISANGGHEYPAIGHGEEDFRLIRTKHGPPRGIFWICSRNRQPPASRIITVKGISSSTGDRPGNSRCSVPCPFFSPGERRISSQGSRRLITDWP